MIRVSIFTDAKGVFEGLEVSGHAGYADSGQDIVCAAVSVLVLNTINSIEQFTEDEFDVESNEEAGLIRLKMKTLSNDSQLLLNSLMLGLQVVEENYGNEYIKLILEEV